MPTSLSSLSAAFPAAENETREHSLSGESDSINPSSCSWQGREVNIHDHQAKILDIEALWNEIYERNSHQRCKSLEGKTLNDLAMKLRGIGYKNIKAIASKEVRDETTPTSEEHHIAKVYAEEISQGFSQLFFKDDISPEYRLAAASSFRIFLRHLENFGIPSDNYKPILVDGLVHIADSEIMTGQALNRLCDFISSLSFIKQGELSYQLVNVILETLETNKNLLSYFSYPRIIELLGTSLKYLQDQDLSQKAHLYIIRLTELALSTNSRVGQCDAKKIAQGLRDIINDPNVLLDDRQQAAKLLISFAVPDLDRNPGEVRCLPDILDIIFNLIVSENCWNTEVKVLAADQFLEVINQQTLSTEVKLDAWLRLLKPLVDDSSLPEDTVDKVRNAFNHCQSRKIIIYGKPPNDRTATKIQQMFRDARIRNFSNAAFENLIEWLNNAEIPQEVSTVIQLELFKQFQELLKKKRSSTDGEINCAVKLIEVVDYLPLFNKLNEFLECKIKSLKTEFPREALSRLAKLAGDERLPDNRRYLILKTVLQTHINEDFIAALSYHVYTQNPFRSLKTMAQKKLNGFLKRGMIASQEHEPLIRKALEILASTKEKYSSLLLRFNARQILSDHAAVQDWDDLLQQAELPTLATKSLLELLSSEELSNALAPPFLALLRELESRRLTYYNIVKLGESLEEWLKILDDPHKTKALQLSIMICNSQKPTSPSLVPLIDLWINVLEHQEIPFEMQEAIRDKLFEIATKRPIESYLGEALLRGLTAVKNSSFFSLDDHRRAQELISSLIVLLCEDNHVNPQKFLPSNHKRLLSKHLKKLDKKQEIFEGCKLDLGVFLQPPVLVEDLGYLYIDPTLEEELKDRLMRISASLENFYDKLFLSNRNQPLLNRFKCVVESLEKLPPDLQKPYIKKLEDGGTACVDRAILTLEEVSFELLSYNNAKIDEEVALASFLISKFKRLRVEMVVQRHYHNNQENIETALFNLLMLNKIWGLGIKGIPIHHSRIAKKLPFKTLLKEGLDTLSADTLYHVVRHDPLFQKYLDRLVEQEKKSESKLKQILAEYEAASERLVADRAFEARKYKEYQEAEESFKKQKTIQALVKAGLFTPL
ncbi:MAG: hypothetical protein ACQEP8_00570 [Chlamydiota bacterium]